jgi:hypothetical protein
MTPPRADGGEFDTVNERKVPTISRPPTNYLLGRPSPPSSRLEALESMEPAVESECEPDAVRCLKYAGILLPSLPPPYSVDAFDTFLHA